MARLLMLCAAVALTGCEAAVPAGPTRHETRTVALDNSEMARLELKMGAGELQIEGGSPNLLDADLTYNVPGWKPVLIDDTTGVRREIRLEQPNGSHAASGTIYNWNLRPIWGPGRRG